MKLTDITKGSEYDLSLFPDEKITKLESQIVLREGKKGSIPSLSAKWLQDDFKMVVKEAFNISVNRCKTYTYNDFSLYISLHSDG